jgi:hypothetical protein
LASLFDVSLDHGASAPARPITAPIMTPFFNLPIRPPGHSVRHGKTRSPKADLTTLLKMRRATPVHHEHAGPSDRANVSHVRLPVRQQKLDFREGVRPPQRGPLRALRIAGRPHPTKMNRSAGDAFRPLPRIFYLRAGCLLVGTFFGRKRSC